MSVETNKIIVSVNNLSYSYGNNQVLKDINFDIHSGDYVGIIGPNGGGKTTLVKLILGILQPQTGNISILGKPLANFSEWSKVGFVAQRATSFDPKFPVTVFDVVAMGLASKKGLFYGLTNTDKKAIDKSLDSVQMLDFKNQLIGNLSGGQQQRVFIARSIVSDPEIIILDEPTAGVDIRSQEEFYKILKRLNQELGITLVLVSHDIDVITNEVTELLCVNQKLVYHGTPKGFTSGKHSDELYSKSVKFVVHRH